MAASTARSLAVAIVLALGLGVTAHVARAQDAAPSQEDMAAAKQAYLDGKAFFAKGKYDKAVDKFKESYKLSKRPALLFNIALTFEKLGTKDMALFYYKKFLSDAPAEDPQRPDAEKSAAALEKEVATSVDTGDTTDTTTTDTTATDTTTTDTTDTTATDTTATDTTDHTDHTDKPKHKRVAAATAEDFQHEIVDEAPPGKPLDITASAPDDAGWEIILYYRGAGDDKFIAAPMKPHYHDLYARVPAAKMTGNAIQYYIEVKDSSGTLVTRIGKATSPNVVFLDESAKPRFYPDVDEGGDEGTSTSAHHDADTSISEEDDNPLDTHPHTTPSGPTGPGPEGHSGWGTGSKNFRYAKWGTTIGGGTMIALSLTFYAMAGSWANSLAQEASVSNSETCSDHNPPPCRPFDPYRANLQATGKRYQTLSRVFVGLGLATGAVAGYLWYKELHSHREKSHPATTGLRSLVAAPVASDDFLGGSAAWRF